MSESETEGEPQESETEGEPPPDNSRRLRGLRILHTQLVGKPGGKLYQ